MTFKTGVTGWLPRKRVVWEGQKETYVNSTRITKQVCFHDLNKQTSLCGIFYFPIPTWTKQITKTVTQSLPNFAKDCKSLGTKIRMRREILPCVMLSQSHRLVQSSLRSCRTASFSIQMHPPQDQRILPSIRWFYLFDKFQNIILRFVSWKYRASSSAFFAR